MSFSNPNTYIEYTGDGNTDRYAINFHMLEGTNELTAEVYDMTNPALPVEVVIAYSVDHTNYPASEVVFVSDIPLGHKVVIQRATLPVQATSFSKGAFPAEAVEETFDRMVMLTQENASEISRSIVNPIVGPSYEDRIDDLEDTSAIHSADILALDARVTATEAFGGDLSSVEAVNDAQDLAIADLEAADTVQDLAIADLISDVTALQTYIDPIVVLFSSVVHNATDKEVILVKADNVTIVLPAATTGRSITVKMDNLRVNCIINSGEGIDGFGLTYTLLSSYESVKLIAAGSQWYII
jgi:uncharacterized coiled-coil protein SlyX